MCKELVINTTRDMQDYKHLFGLNLTRKGQISSLTSIYVAKLGEGCVRTIWFFIIKSQTNLDEEYMYVAHDQRATYCVV